MRDVIYALVGGGLAGAFVGVLGTTVLLGALDVAMWCRRHGG
jgi:hypothetical protein